VNVANIDFVTAVWSDADGSDANGTLYTVKFKAKENASGIAVFNLTSHDIFDNTSTMNTVSVMLYDTEVVFSNNEEIPKTDIPANELPTKGVLKNVAKTPIK